MTCSVRVLSTQRIDSSPSILLVSSDGSKTLVNCGEGCQRTFLEFGQKISTINRVCLTHLSHESIGGLPGLVLTAADVVTGAVAKAKAVLNSDKMATTSVTTPTKSGIELIGPTGTKAFINSLRHFMRRDAFEVRINEGAYFQSKTKKLKKRKRKGSGNEESMHVQSIACRFETIKEEEKSSNTREVLSYIFTTPPVQGKFQANKAKALGIPPGPLYGQLKSGKRIKFTNSCGKEIAVESEEVVEPGSPGFSVGVLCYPDNHILDQLSVSPILANLQEVDPEKPRLDAILHLTSFEIFSSERCRSWIQQFSREVDHVFVETGGKTPPSQKSGTTFHAAFAGAMNRSKLSSDIYGSLVPFSSEESPNAIKQSGEFAYLHASPLLEYVILPRTRSGFQNQRAFEENWIKVQREANDLLMASGSSELATSILSNKAPKTHRFRGELLFTGTGSAIPCKHRNVSGIYLRMENNNSMLLDIGEGTVGQLLRAKEGGDYEEIIRGIKAVWISHPHADHHLGILRLLSEKRKFNNDPLILIAPPGLLSFLEEYQSVDSTIEGSYEFLSCLDVTQHVNRSDWPEERSRLIEKRLRRLDEELGITSCITVPVAHCKHSFAIVLDGTSFGRLAYSGDCRPSFRFADVAQNADLLIHEATFEQGMEAEATLKRHSTVGEALLVAKRMKAKATILTHFSQRYPRVPPLPVGNHDIEENSSVIFAYDFMSVTPGNLVAASMITPALRLLYPDTEEQTENLDKSSGAMNVPGLFAQADIL